MAAHPRVGVAALVMNEEGKLLVGKRKGSHGSGTWQLPGGHLEHSEDWATTAMRELEEEAGLAISKEDFTFVSVTNDVFESESKHYITIFMAARAKKGSKPVVKEPHKCECWEWRYPHDIPKPWFLPLEHFISGLGFPPASPSSANHVETLALLRQSLQN
uniref:Nudix hydrolase domain-containing protein n=1 Tax=Palpitomonas bilix TaxID=652834 RepID=A0A7S3DJF5_9EUKA|mmetsp:Transcript_40652/g.105537  ORF Transcript_40652/g.105537 Transcript_40652/m.105537 type:complete len:160 (-) Transcript_40652:162-641(-)